MTPLEAHLHARIARDGPLNVQQFMEEALGNPDFGYYMTRDPFGEAGDFVTAPEVSQIFGELTGAWMVAVWQAMGQPHPVNLIELGPGRGTLMADALRATKNVPGFANAARLHLVETSPVLRTRQKATLNGATVSEINWWRDISQIGDGPSIIIANEFFDALPIRQFVRDLGQWRERLIEPDPSGEGLRFTISATPARPHFIPPVPGEIANGEVVETSPAGLRCMHTIAARLGAAPGAMLAIDYGHTETSVGETLQAVRGHRYSDVLKAPGEQDLTAHVDFAALARVAETCGARVHGPITQGLLLARLGIDLRLQALLGAAADAATSSTLVAGARRLTDPDAMGILFKAMAISSPQLDSLPAFEDPST